MPQNVHSRTQRYDSRNVPEDLLHARHHRHKAAHHDKILNVAEDGDEDHHNKHHNAHLVKHKKHHVDPHASGEYNDDDDENTDSDEVDSAAFYNDDGTPAYGLKARLLNNTRKAGVDFVFFNRVPKVGSQALMMLMQSLGKINGFRHMRDSGKAHETVMINPHKQQELIGNLSSRHKPHVYSQHIAYINFTRFHMPKPIYINLVRDPIERLISWHYYVRARWYYIDMKDKLGDIAPPMPDDDFLNMDMDTCVRNNDKHCRFTQMEIKNAVGDHRRQTLFFCGQNFKVCMPFNSPVAMQKAKRTVEEDYAVVGTWEDTNITLTVLEHYIPRYFRNAKVAYYLGKEHLSRVNRNNVTKIVSDETREILRKNLTNEIEFYEFCKQRLYLQYAAINNGKRIDNDDYILMPEHENDPNDMDDY